MQRLNRVIVIENRQKNFQFLNWQKNFQLQLSTFENLQLKSQQNRVINYNSVNYKYNFFKLDCCTTIQKTTNAITTNASSSLQFCFI